MAARGFHSRLEWVLHASSAANLHPPHSNPPSLSADAKRLKTGNGWAAGGAGGVKPEPQDVKPETQQQQQQPPAAAELEWEDVKGEPASAAAAAAEEEDLWEDV